MLQVLGPRLYPVSMNGESSFFIMDTIEAFLDAELHSEVKLQSFKQVTEADFVTRIKLGKVTSFLHQYDFTTDFYEEWKKSCPSTAADQLSAPNGYKDHSEHILDIMKALGLPIEHGIFCASIYRAIEQKQKKDNSFSGAVVNLVLASVKLAIWQLGFLRDADDRPAQVISRPTALIDQVAIFKAAFKNLWKVPALSETYRISPDSMAQAGTMVAQSILSALIGAQEVVEELVAIGQYFSKRFKLQNYGYDLPLNTYGLHAFLYNQEPDNALKMSDFQLALQRIPTITSGTLTGMTVFGKLGLFGIPDKPVIQPIEEATKVRYSSANNLFSGLIDITENWTWEILAKSFSTNADFNVLGIGETSVPFAFGNFLGERVTIKPGVTPYLSPDGIMSLRDPKYSFSLLPQGDGLYKTEELRLNIDRSLFGLPTLFFPPIQYCGLSADGNWITPYFISQNADLTITEDLNVAPFGIYNVTGKDHPVTINKWTDNEVNIDLAGDGSEMVKLKHKVPSSSALNHVPIYAQHSQSSYIPDKTFKLKTSEFTAESTNLLTLKTILKRSRHILVIKNHSLETFSSCINKIFPLLDPFKLEVVFSTMLKDFCAAASPTLKSSVARYTRPFERKTRIAYACMMYGILASYLSLIGLRVIPISAHIIDQIEFDCQSEVRRIQGLFNKS